MSSNEISDSKEVPANNSVLTKSFLLVGSLAALFGMWCLGRTMASNEDRISFCNAEAITFNSVRTSVLPEGVTENMTCYGKGTTHQCLDSESGQWFTWDGLRWEQQVVRSTHHVSEDTNQSTTNVGVADSQSRKQYRVEHKHGGAFIYEEHTGVRVMDSMERTMRPDFIPNDSDCIVLGTSQWCSNGEDRFYKFGGNWFNWTEQEMLNTRGWDHDGRKLAFGQAIQSSSREEIPDVDMQTLDSSHAFLYYSLQFESTAPYGRERYGVLGLYNDSRDIVPQALFRYNDAVYDQYPWWKTRNSEPYQIRFKPSTDSADMLRALAWDVGAGDGILIDYELLHFGSGNQRMQFKINRDAAVALQDINSGCIAQVTSQACASFGDGFLRNVGLSASTCTDTVSTCGTVNFGITCLEVDTVRVCEVAVEPGSWYALRLLIGHQQSITPYPGQTIPEAGMWYVLDNEG